MVVDCQQPAFIETSESRHDLRPSMSQFIIYNNWICGSMTFHKTRNILTPLYDMWFLISCLLYVLAVTTSSRWKSPVQHQKAFWPSCFRGCRRYGGYEHAVRTGHQPANSWETKGVYDNDFTTSIKISLVRRYYFICTPFFTSCWSLPLYLRHAYFFWWPFISLVNLH